MFHHVANAGACAFQGEYFEACKRFARTDESEIKLNNTISPPEGISFKLLRRRKFVEESAGLQACHVK